MYHKSAKIFNNSSVDYVDKVCITKLLSLRYISQFLFYNDYKFMIINVLYIFLMHFNILFINITYSHMWNCMIAFAIIFLSSCGFSKKIKILAQYSGF